MLGTCYAGLLISNDLFQVHILLASGQPNLDRIILCPWLSLPVTEGSQGSNPRTSDLKANMLYAVGPRFHDSVRQEFLASLRPAGF